MNSIKINPYRSILCRFISVDISNIDLFLLQTIWVNDFPYIISAAGKKRNIDRLDQFLKQ